MIARVILGGICTVLTLYIAVRSDNEKIRTSSAFVASCLVSFTATTLVLERGRRQKGRPLRYLRSSAAHVDAYVDILRQMNHEQRMLLEDQTPKVCRGCVHYHGRSYGGERLICAMHPYGVEYDECGDREES
jgi:hypothetical protein